MIADSKADAVRTLDRINLRLAPETFDASSRKTWITEAVEEKLARERALGMSSDQDRSADV
jgi:hypothetical protein